MQQSNAAAKSGQAFSSSIYVTINTLWETWKDDN